MATKNQSWIWIPVLEKRKRDSQELRFKLIGTWKCIKYAFAHLTAYETLSPQEEMKKYGDAHRIISI